jgi:hypothetical protein
MSGYSAVLFVAYAGVAYTSAITVYFWGFASIGIGVGIGSWLFAGRWNRLRSKLGQKVDRGAVRLPAAAAPR